MFVFTEYKYNVCYSVIRFSFIYLLYFCRKSLNGESKHIRQFINNYVYYISGFIRIVWQF